MRRRKQIITVLALLMAMLSPYVLPVISNRVIAQAATTVTGEREFKLKVGESKTLSITGTSKKISWKSSDKSVASVSSKGKVLAVKTGIAIITANINGKKYNYTVTVYDTNAYLDKAEFEAIEVFIGEISFVIPKDMEFSEETMKDEYGGGYVCLDTGVDGRNITISTSINNWGVADYDTIKERIGSETLDMIYQDQYAITGNEDIELSDYKLSDHKSPNGLVCKREYMLNHSQKIVDYYQEFDHFTISVSVLDANNTGLDSIAEFMIDSATPLPQ